MLSDASRGSRFVKLQAFEVGFESVILTTKNNAKMMISGTEANKMTPGSVDFKCNFGLDHF